VSIFSAYTTEDRDALASVPFYTIIFNTSTSQYEYWNGAIWQGLLGDIVTTFGLIASNFLVGGKFTVYDSLAVEGMGVPPILDAVNLTSQTAAIAPVNFDNGNVVGDYRAAYYMVVTNAHAAAGTIRFDVTYNDGSAARTLTGQTVSLAALNKSNLWTNTDTNGSLIHLGSGNIAYSVTLTGSIGNAIYALYVTLERLR